MSYLLELLGKGLDAPLMSLVLPFSGPLSNEEVQLLNETIKDEPHHTANKLRLAIHHSQSGATGIAEKIFSNILEAKPNYAEAYLAWAAMYSSSNLLDKAIEKLQQGREHCGNDSRILFGLGYCHERKGEIDEALRFYQEGNSCKPYLRQIKERMAAVHLFQGEYDKATEQCRTLLRAHPEDVWLYLVLGQFYLQTQQYLEAIAIFEKALTIEPDNFDGHNDQIDAFAKEGRVDEAIERMHQIINEEQGDFPDSYVRLADLYSQLGNDAVAINNYQRALDMYPGFLEAAVKMGTQHMRMQRNYEAATMFSRAIEINDRIITAYVGLALSYKYNNQPERAGDTLELALALEPNTNLLFAEMNRLQMKVAMAQKENTSESEVWQVAVEEQDQSPEAEELLDIQFKRYEKALEQNPNQADLHYYYSLLLRSKGKAGAALEHLQNALTTNPSYQQARIKAGLNLYESNKVEACYDQLAQALLLDEEYCNLHYKLGLMYCDRIQFALAVEHFESAIETKHAEANIQSNLALALQNMGLIDRAAAYWRAVCELDPQSKLAFQAQRSVVHLKLWSNK
jgi:tetratricopeptide (TPR) repeat protein